MRSPAEAGLLDYSVLIRVSPRPAATASAVWLERPARPRGHNRAPKEAPFTGCRLV